MSEFKEQYEEPVEETDLQFASDVLWVYARIGSHVGPRSKNVTKARFELHQWASNPDNKAKFFTSMVPAAGKVIQESKKLEDDAELVKKEKKSIAELREFLNRAVAESKEIV